MNTVDKFIGIFSPRTAFNRARYRLATDAVTDSQRKFDAAAKSRRTNGWVPSAGSPNMLTLGVLSTIRNRSRDLTINNPYAKRAIQAIKNNVVGTGIRPTPSGSEAEIRKVKEAWWKWAETKQCDWNGKETFYGLQKLVISTVVQDGEVIVRKRRSSDSRFPVKLQVCEADHIDDSKEAPKTSGGGWIMQGVEYDSAGVITHYYLFDRHPSDSLKLTSERVPASEVLHIFLQDRAGQVRGIPWFASVAIKMRDFDDFEDAQLMQQKIAACFAAFVTKEDTNSVTGSTPTESETSERIEPGIIEHLQPGESVSFANPPSTAGQETFSKKVLQAIAAGYGITYESLTGDLSNVNFSSGRMGWLEMHRNIQEWQQRIMIPQFCDPVWEWFLQGAKMSGMVKDDKIIADWTPPRREMIDPVKEINGLVTMINAGFDSWQDVVRQLGYDPDLVIEQLQADLKKFDAAGIKVSSDFRNSVMNKSNTAKNE